MRTVSTQTKWETGLSLELEPGKMLGDIEYR